MGVGLVVIGPEAGFDTVGILAGLGGAATMALGVTLTKRWGRPADVGPTAFASWQLTAGGLVLLPVTFLFEGAPPAIDLSAGLGYLWLGLIGGLLAYVLWFRGITSLPVTSVAVLGLLSPMVAAVLGAALLGQSLGLLQLAGFALALASIVAGQITPKTKQEGREGPLHYFGEHRSSSSVFHPPRQQRRVARCGRLRTPFGLDLDLDVRLVGDRVPDLLDRRQQ